MHIFDVLLPGLPAGHASDCVTANHYNVRKCGENGMKYV